MRVFLLTYAEMLPIVIKRAPSGTSERGLVDVELMINHSTITLKSKLTLGTRL